MLKQVDDLSCEARQILDGLLIEFCEYNRGTPRCVIRSNCVSELKALGLFDFRPLGTEFPPRKVNGTLTGWDFSRIAAEVTAEPEYAKLFAAEQDKRKAERAPYIAERDAAKERGDRQEEKRLDKFLKNDLPGEETKAFISNWLNSSDGIPARDFLAEPYRFACIKSDWAIYIEELYRDGLVGTSNNRSYPRSVWWQDAMLSVKEMTAEEERRINLSSGYTEEEKTKLLNSAAETCARWRAAYLAGIGVEG